MYQNALFTVIVQAVEEHVTALLENYKRLILNA